MKRGYALKERSKGKKNELVKRKEMNPKEDQESVSVQNATTILFLQKISLCAIS